MHYLLSSDVFSFFKSSEYSKFSYLSLLLITLGLFYFSDLAGTILNLSPFFMLPFIGSCESESNSSGGSSSGTDCGSGGSSTPFLKVKIGHETESAIVNDIMVGSPTSKFFDVHKGRDAFSSGKVGFDVFPYTLQEQQRAHSLSSLFTLKEIEHETSYINRLEYATLAPSTNKDDVLALDFTHQKLSHLNTAAIRSTSPVSLANDVTAMLPSGAAATPTATDADLQPVTLNAGEEMFFAVTADAGDALVVGAYARNIDDQYLYKTAVQRYLYNENDAVASTLYTRSKKALSYTLATTLAMVGLHNYTPANYLDTAGFVNVAQASTPVSRSLYFYYKNANGQWQEFAVIHPRFYLTHPTIISLPSEVCIGEAVEIKVHSTLMHKISTLGLVGAEHCVLVDELSYQPVVARNTETREEIVLDGMSELVTQPGYEYELVLQPEHVTAVAHVIFKIHGFYVPAAPKNKIETESWWGRLTTSEKALYTNEA